MWQQSKTKSFKRFHCAQKIPEIPRPRRVCHVSKQERWILCTLQVSFGTGEVTGVFVEERAHRTGVKRLWSHKSGEVFLSCANVPWWMMCHVLQDVICFGQRGPGMDTSSTNVPIAGKDVSLPKFCYHIWFESFFFPSHVYLAGKHLEADWQ